MYQYTMTHKQMSGNWVVMQGWVGRKNDLRAVLGTEDIVALGSAFSSWTRVLQRMWAS